MADVCITMSTAWWGGKVGSVHRVYIRGCLCKGGSIGGPIEGCL